MAQQEAQGQAAPAKKFPIKAILTGLFLLINFGVVGGGAFLAYQATLGYQYAKLSEEEAGKDWKSEREKEGPKPVMYTMEPFTVNLNTNPQKMIRIEVNLEMLDEEGFEEVVSLGAGARDEIVRVLHDKNLDDIETIQGKLFLKDQIVVTLNHYLQKGVVKDVFFSEFLVQ